MQAPGQIGRSGRLGLQANARLTLLARAIAAIRRNNGALFYVPQNFVGSWTDSTGTDPVDTVADVIGRMTDRAGGSAVATQSTTANKPVVGRGLFNLLTYSHDFSNAAWPAAFTRTLSAGIGPGGTDAWTITGTATGAVFQRPITATSTAISLAVIEKPGTFNSSSGFLIRNHTTSTNLTSTTTTVDLGNGWTLRTLSANTGIALGNEIRLYFGAATTVPNGQSWYLQSAAAFNGTLTAQQIISAGGIPLTTTAPAWSATGNYHINFDGSNDSLTTNITTGGEGWVCTGLTVSTLFPANQTIFYSGADGDALPGAWLSIQGTNIRQTIGDGTSRNNVVGSALSVGVPTVVESGWGAGQIFVGQNGVFTTGTKTIDCATPRLFSIGIVGSAFPLSGSISAFMYCPVLPSAADRAIIRKWIGSLQGQTL